MMWQMIYFDREWDFTADEEKSKNMKRKGSWVYKIYIEIEDKFEKQQSGTTKHVPDLRGHSQCSEGR